MIHYKLLILLSVSDLAGDLPFLCGEKATDWISQTVPDRIDVQVRLLSLSSPQSSQIHTDQHPDLPVRVLKQSLRDYANTFPGYSQLLLADDASLLEAVLLGCPNSSASSCPEVNPDNPHPEGLNPENPSSAFLDRYPHPAPRAGLLQGLLIGDYPKNPALARVLCDILPPGEEESLLAFHLAKALERLRDAYEADFYQQAMTATINTVPDMMWYKRIDGIHMLVNDAFCEIVRKKKSDIHGKDHFYIWDVPRPQDGDGDFACAESEELALQSGKTYICEEMVKTRKGMKQFTTYKTPIYDNLGNIFGTVGLGHDATNLKNLGLELSILIENMPFPMSIFTGDFHVVRMNRHFKELIGNALMPVGDSSQASSLDGISEAEQDTYYLQLDYLTSESPDHDYRLIICSGKKPACSPLAAVSKTGMPIPPPGNILSRLAGKATF